MPVPCSGILYEPWLSVITVRITELPAKVAAAVGAKLTPKVTCWPGATGAGRLMLLVLNGAPDVMLRPVMLKVRLPVLVTETTLDPGFGILMFCCPKATVVGSTMAEVGIPVPVILAVWVLGTALSVKVTVALRTPTLVGLKFTFTVQLLPIATLVQVEVVAVKSEAAAPDTAMPLASRLKVALPVLVRTRVCGNAGKPTAWLVNTRLLVLKLTAGCVTEMPVTDTGMEVGVPLLAMVSVAT